MIKVLIVDDSSFMRVKIRTSLEKDPGIKVIGIARNGIDAVNKAVSLKPDVITMDVNMPDMTGLAAVERIMDIIPTPIIMISSLTYDGSYETLRALECGAVDYLPKDGLNDYILIEKVHMAANAIVKRSPLKKKSPSRIYRKGFAIVGIGISTGGPNALAKIIPDLSPDISAPIVVAQHMPPVFTASLANRLNDKSKLPVLEAANNMTLEQGHIYICPGGNHITIDSWGKVTLHPKEDYPNRHYVPSADLLMASLGKTYKEKSLCLIMTGMGQDGMLGVKEAKRWGSSVMAQSKETSTIYGMPRAVIANNLQDEIVHLDHISGRINQLCIED